MKEMLAIAFTALLLVFAVISVKKDNDKWEAFKLEHECKVVGRKDGQSSFGTDSGGKTVTMHTSQTAWLCNDGVTYWKNGK